MEEVNKKEVKEVKVDLRDDNFYLLVYLGIKRGLRPSQIAMKYKITKQRLNWYIRHLKLNGYIEKVSYGAWKITKKEVKVEPRDTKLVLTRTFTSFKQKKSKFLSDSVRGHAFSFVLKLPRMRNWNNRVKWLEREKVPFSPIGFGGSGQSIEFKYHKVWLCNHSIVVYFPKWKQYFTDTARESKNYAVYDFLEIIKSLERFLGCSFRINKKYKFKVAKRHYALIKNSLANQYNREGKKLFVYDEGDLWLWIDDSDTLKEIETKRESDSEKVQNFFNSVKKYGLTLEDIKKKFSVIDEIQNESLDRIKINSEGQINVSMVLQQVDSNLKKLTKVILKDG